MNHFQQMLLGAILLTGAACTGWAANEPFAFDPAGASPALTPGTGDANPLGLATYPAGSYTADTFNFFDNAIITIQTNGDMTETGIFSTSDLLYLGNHVGPAVTGININYGIYGTFTATGHGTLGNTTLDTLNFILHADRNNNTTFALDGSAVFNNADDFNLASGSLIVGSAQVTGPPFNLALQSQETFVPAGGQSGFYLYPVPFYIRIGDSFTAFGQQTITTSGDCVSLTTVCQITITGGAGTAGFVSPVPEPASIALIGLGLLGLGVTRKGKRKQS